MTRHADHPIAPYLLARHSRVALTDAPVSEADVLSLLEAARWAPSASNIQPWRFLYTLRGTPEFDAIFDGLAPFNQNWAGKAGGWIVALSQHEADDGKPQRWHAFDTGAAWLSISLQGAHLGLLTHALGGFDADKVRAALEIPANFTIQAVIVVGHPGKTEDLPEAIRGRDVPNQRHPLETRAAAGKFPTAWAPKPA